MSDSLRIGELEKKFAENPRRYFAPLANEYRKAGDHERAIEMCESFLAQTPEHMSGQIVLGQALFESNRRAEARRIFESALALDPANLIALRHLGDIERAAGQPEAARSFYQRVLESDPRNENALQSLTELAREAEDLPPGYGEVEPVPRRTAEYPSPELEPPSVDAVGHADLPAPDPDDQEFIADLNSPDWPTALEEQGGEPDSGAGAELPSGFESNVAAPDEDPGLVRMADYPIARTGEYRAPESEKAPASAQFRTQTMADLYLQQGFPREALEVYRHLLAQRPDDAALAARITEIEASMAPAEPIAEAGAEIAADEVIPAVEEAATTPEEATAAADEATPVIGDVAAAADEMSAVADESSPAESGAEAPSPAPEPLVVPDTWELRAAEITEPGDELASVSTPATLLDPYLPAAVVESGPTPEIGLSIREYFALLGTARPQSNASDTYDSAETGNDAVQSSLPLDRFFRPDLPAESGLLKAGAPAPPRPMEGAESEEDVQKFRTWLEGLADS